MGEHLLCKQGVSGSIPLSSTIFHSLFPDRRPLTGGADLETGRSTERFVAGRFPVNRLRAGLARSIHWIGLTGVDV